MDGIALRDPSLKKIEAARVKVHDTVLKDGVRKRVVAKSRYRTKSRRWVNLSFEDGCDLAVPADTKLLVHDHQLELELA